MPRFDRWFAETVLKGAHGMDASPETSTTQSGFRGLERVRQRLAAMALTPGTRLGPYEITAQIGVGGMWEVSRATDTKLDRDVAINT